MAKIVITTPERDKPTDPPPGFPPLSRKDIVAWSGEVAMQHGAPYVAGALFDTRRVGHVLKARCQGTAAHPYRVTATVGAQGGITESTCSCPVGGRCKHVAALLLNWLRDPEAFTEVEDVETTLERRDKAELIALVRQMLARHPELETLLELPLPVAGKRNKPADVARIRREVAAAFRTAGDDWYGASEAAQSLEPLVDLGDEYARLGDWSNAATVYKTIAEEVIEHYEEVQDDEGDLNDVIDQCVEGLGVCLQSIEDTAQREELLRALFDLYHWDVMSGGIGMAEQAPVIIVDHSTLPERQLVAGWVRDAFPTGDQWSSRWRSQALGGFLLRLAGDEVDDETFLQICRDTGRRRDLVDRLLHLGRIEEAETEVRRAGDDEVLQLADILGKHGQAERAERLVRERYNAPQSQARFSGWLRDRARERGDLGEALALTETLFWQHPGVSGYDGMKELAQALGTWDTLRPEMLRRLVQKQQHRLLTEIHLHEGEIEQALATVTQATLPGFGVDPLSIQVARAAETSHPSQSIALYRSAAERLIRAQGRDNYRTATSYLARIRDLYRGQGMDATWNALIAEIRTQNRRLRALREELDRAGL